MVDNGDGTKGETSAGAVPTILKAREGFVSVSRSGQVRSGSMQAQRTSAEVDLRLSGRANQFD